MIGAVSGSRLYRAGESVEDVCRSCKTDRFHTVIVADPGGRPIRVQCDSCDSQHNYRGGPTLDAMTLSVPPAPAASARAVHSHAGASTHTHTHTHASAHAELGRIVGDRERIAPPMTVPDRPDDLEFLLRRIIREEAGLTPVAPAQKWRGGTMALRPGTPGLQEKTWPIDTFFHKVVMLRNRLRALEQQVNASDLPDDVKVKLQGYVSGCYGSLTSFNVLFADEHDQFKGSGGGE
jgi:hypothetical protein